MIGPDEALRLVLGAATERCPRQVELIDACGLLLAEAVRADRDYPPFPRATMDGYAVRTASAGQIVEVVGEVAAGDVVKTRVTREHCLEIMTGAPCPPGTEAVVQKEEAVLDEDRVQLPSTILAGQNIAPRGSECRRGDLILRPGQTVTPLAVAVLASVGRRSVSVIPRPSLAVITTGAELIPPGRDPPAGKIRNFNGAMLSAMAGDMGIDRPLHRHAEDRPESILAALGEVADRDVILLTGGVSAGRYDLVPQAVWQYGAEPVFHKVTQKPGKPLLVARKEDQLLFGLPGNPLGCHLCFHRYVAAAIRKMEGRPAETPSFQGHLAGPVEPKADRTFFIAAHAEHKKGVAADWLLHPMPGTTSADVFTSCRANCYAQVPPGGECLGAGEILAFTWIGGACTQCMAWETPPPDR